MKNKIIPILFLFSVFTGFLACNKKTNDTLELLGLAFRAVIVSNRVVIDGTVKGPGTIQGAKVNVFATPSNGKCLTNDGSLNGTPLATALSDVNGNYTLSYTKTGTTMCVVVMPTDGSQVEVFSPGTKTNNPKPWSGKNSLMAVINEPSNSTSFGVTGAKKKVNVTPFTSMAGRRFGALTAINGGVKVKSKVFMGITSGSGVGTRGKEGGKRAEFAANNATSLLDKATDDVENAFFPKRDKVKFSLESADVTDPGYALKLGSIAITADKRGGGTSDGSATAEDFDKVITFMEEDFSDGRFDGKKIDPVTNKIAVLSAEDLGGVVGSVAEADNFLKGTFKAAMQEYDSYDTEHASSASDLFFCDTDSLDPACALSVLPGSPPEVWVFGPDGEFIDLDGTFNFGRVGISGAGLYGGTARTGEFTIVNSGGSDLVLTLPITFSDARFTVLAQPEATVASGDAAYLQVQFVPTSATSFSATTSIVSNDTVYSPYPFNSTGNGENLSTNLQLHWAFNGDTQDSGPNSFHSDSGSGASPTLDLFGEDDMAYYFDGSSDIGYASGISLSGINTATFSVWVAPSDISYVHSILSQGVSPQFQLHFQNDSDIVFTTDAGSVVDITFPIDPDDFLDQWNLITGVYDGTNMYLYINGELVSQVAQAGNFGAPTAFTVGNNASSAAFEGDIDDVRIYNRALTANQIEALYNQD